MIVDVEIAFAVNLKIKQTMFREQFEHVIEKRQTCRHLSNATTIERKRHSNVCLFGFAMNLSRSNCGFLSCHILILTGALARWPLASSVPETVSNGFPSLHIVTTGPKPRCELEQRQSNISFSAASN